MESLGGHFTPEMRLEKEKQTIFYQMSDIDFFELWSYHCKHYVWDVQDK